jgi:glycosyltransferase involved in cell wall biosynthesis
MKILHILPSMDLGGIERGVYDFSIKASELGNEVIIACGNGRFIPPLIEKGIRWHNVPMDSKTLPVFLKSCRRLKKIIKEEKPDIIHAQSRFPCWIVYYVMKSFPEVPWVTSIHNFHTVRWYSGSVGKGKLVITVSNTLKKYAAEYLRIKEEKIRVVYNGIAEGFINLTRTPLPDFTVGMIARFTAWKGHFFFLSAVKKLSDEGIKIRALIVGSGSRSYRTKLEKWITENSMGYKVQIVTMDAIEALEKINVLIVPSLEPEGFGRTVVEAQFSKTPVIGTRLGAIPELIEDGRTGFLVEPGKVEQLADKIRFVLQNPEVVSTVVNAAFDSAVKDFTVSHITEKVLNVYNELLLQK